MIVRMLAVALLSLAFGVGPVTADQNNKGNSGALVSGPPVNAEPTRSGATPQLRTLATRPRPAATMIAQSNCGSNLARGTNCHTYCNPSECANGTCNANNAGSSNGKCN